MHDDDRVEIDSFTQREFHPEKFWNWFTEISDVQGFPVSDSEIRQSGPSEFNLVVIARRSEISIGKEQEKSGDGAECNDSDRDSND